MKAVYDGKTKRVMVDEASGETYLFFKDDATGKDGVFDPGSNEVGGSVLGKGRTGLAISKYFFEMLEAKGVPTHYLGADLDKCLMKVRRVTVPKLEFVLRYFTAGSMCSRFSIEPGIPFDPPYLEVTLKNDAQGDPLISERLCLMKGMLKEGEYDKSLKILLQVGDALRDELRGFGLTLIDLKIEIGFDENRDFFLADEVTPDIWRVQDESGNIPDQITCAKLLLEKINARAGL
ncbi:MAG: phosphoribosylaminoimidazolesuccinocarboxamide synthase [Oscillospiraceae bacterium]|nr:phosphoribosylaminoimidazolesuccinocarboxamide synthase [Oscillospiraceae bacterium]